MNPKDNVEISGIFGDRVAGKVLVVGKAGVGKTTLMHYISYKWAINQLWNYEFDYVFRVRLKDLNTGWENIYQNNF